MVGWLVTQFSQKRLKGFFLIFFMKLGDYKGKKVTEPNFWKKFLIWRYSRKGLQISPKSDTLIFFSKTAVTIFLVFGLQFEWNLFFRKICNLEIFDLKIVKKLPKLRFFGHFLDSASLVFLDVAHNVRWAWGLVVFLQFAGRVNVFLFKFETLENVFNSYRRILETVSNLKKSAMTTFSKTRIHKLQ